MNFFFINLGRGIITYIYFRESTRTEELFKTALRTPTKTAELSFLQDEKFDL